MRIKDNTDDRETVDVIQLHREIQILKNEPLAKVYPRNPGRFRNTNDK